MRVESSSFGVTEVLLGLATVAAVAAGVACVLFYQDVRLIRQDGLPVARADLQTLRAEDRILREIRRQAPTGLSEKDRDRDRLLTFIEEQALQRGIRNVKNIAPVAPSRREGFKEYPIDVDIPEAPISNLVQFMYQVERRRPFVKATEVRVQNINDDGNCMKVKVAFATYEPAD